MKPAVRLSFGIVALSTSLLFVADSALDIFPDPNASILEARQDLSETLAVQYERLSATTGCRKCNPLSTD